MDMSLSKLWEIGKDRKDWHAAAHGVTESWTQLSNCTTTTDNSQVMVHGWRAQGSFCLSASWSSRHNTSRHFIYLLTVGREKEKGLANFLDSEI